MRCSSFLNLDLQHFTVARDVAGWITWTQLQAMRIALLDLEYCEIQLLLQQPETCPWCDAELAEAGLAELSPLLHYLRRDGCATLTEVEYLCPACQYRIAEQVQPGPVALRS